MSVPAKRYLVTEHGAVACSWYYEIEAASAEEAIAIVKAGDADPFDCVSGDTIRVDEERYSAITSQENLL